MNTIPPLERQKLMILAFIGLLYSVGIAVLVQNMMSQGFPVTDDFFSRWYASKMLLTTGRSVYDWANSVELSRIGNWPLVHQLGYYYPAYLLIFTAPLSLLPFAAARIVWTVAGLWCLWLGMVIMARQLTPPLPVNRLTLLLVLTTISVPVLQHTLNAQFNTLGVLALALTFRALRRQQYWQAGLWAGGLLFKPQATALVLLVWLIWTLFGRQRRAFWLGLGAVSLAFWGIAEILEPGWVIHFWQALNTYEPTRSVVDRLWNPAQVISLALVAITIWLAVRLRGVSAGAVSFSGLILWGLCINALIVPLFGMLHMVLIGLMAIILVSDVAATYPAWEKRAWWGVIVIFVLGLAVFVGSLAGWGLAGPHIVAAELVYKIIVPAALALVSLLLMFSRPEAGQKVEVR
jgi:hypothetical protein